MAANEGAAADAAASLGCAYRTFERHCKKIGLALKRGTARRASARKQKVISELATKVDRALFRWPDARTAKEEIAARFMSPAKVRKVLVFSDLHCPTQATNLVEEMLAADGDADFGVHAGDAFNADCLSRFRKEVAVPWEREWNDGVIVARAITSKLPVVWMETNHERRLIKALQDRQLDSGVIEWLEDRGIHIISELVAALRGTGSEALPSPWMPLGDVFITHFEDEHSTVPSRSACNVLDWVMNNITEDFQGVVQAHTHKQAWVRHRNRFALECGCLCHDQDYVIESGRTAQSKREPWQRGYVVLYFDKDGCCDWKQSRCVPLDYRARDYL